MDVDNIRSDESISEDTEYQRDSPASFVDETENHASDISSFRPGSAEVSESDFDASSADIASEAAFLASVEILDGTFTRQENGSRRLILPNTNIDNSLNPFNDVESESPANEEPTILFDERSGKTLDCKLILRKLADLSVETLKDYLAGGLTCSSWRNHFKEHRTSFRVDLVGAPSIEAEARGLAEALLCLMDKLKSLTIAFTGVVKPKLFKLATLEDSSQVEILENAGHLELIISFVGQSVTGTAILLFLRKEFCLLNFSVTEVPLSFVFVALCGLTLTTEISDCYAVTDSRNGLTRPINLHRGVIYPVDRKFDALNTFLREIYMSRDIKPSFSCSSRLNGLTTMLEVNNCLIHLLAESFAFTPIGILMHGKYASYEECKEFSGIDANSILEQRPAKLAEIGGLVSRLWPNQPLYHRTLDTSELGIVIEPAATVLVELFTYDDLITLHGILNNITVFNCVCFSSCSSQSVSFLDYFLSMLYGVEYASLDEDGKSAPYAYYTCLSSTVESLNNAKSKVSSLLRGATARNAGHYKTFPHSAAPFTGTLVIYDTSGVNIPAKNKMERVPTKYFNLETSVNLQAAIESLSNQDRFGPELREDLVETFLGAIRASRRQYNLRRFELDQPRLYFEREFTENPYPGLTMLELDGDPFAFREIIERHSAQLAALVQETGVGE